MPMCLKIKENAIFFADVHINDKRDDFYEVLKKIEKEDLFVSQIFLMGDIFDLLIGGIDWTIKINKKYVDLLNKLSEKIEIYYFEGNHDFNLSKIFPKIKLFPLKNQPIIAIYKNKKILLSHGDILSSKSYEIYSKIIRNKFVLKILDFLDNNFNNFISKIIISKQKDKNICKKIKNFKEIVKKRLKNIDLKNIDYYIEGHFHQNKKFDFKQIIYINLPSFACNKSFIIVEYSSEFKIMQF